MTFRHDRGESAKIIQYRADSESAVTALHGGDAHSTNTMKVGNVNASKPPRGVGSLTQNVSSFDK